jgi:hypothetical protein
MLRYMPLLMVVVVAIEETDDLLCSVVVITPCCILYRARSNTAKAEGPLRHIESQLAHSWSAAVKSAR